MKRLLVTIACALPIACGGSPNTPDGPVVGSGGNGGPPAVFVKAAVTVQIPTPAPPAHDAIRPAFLSPNTQSVSISLATVNGRPVSGGNAATIDISRRSKNCTIGGGTIACRGTVDALPGLDAFNVSTFAGPSGTGDVLSVGTVRARVGTGGGKVFVTPSGSAAIQGVIAALAIDVSPKTLPRGKKGSASVSLRGFDSTGAPIDGPGRYQTPIALSIQGDAVNAFLIDGAGKPAASVSVVSPAQKLALAYDGNAQALPITLSASVTGPNATSANAPFAIQGTPPPPPVGTIYALNAGTAQGRGATVTVYDGNANGNAVPKRTLELDAKLYARSIAVDGKGNLYVGYLDNAFGASPEGVPDIGNEIAIYAPTATGKAAPAAVITADASTKTALFPTYLAFDPQGDLVTYGATTVDANAGNAALVYAAGSNGAAKPAAAWSFAAPTFDYAFPGPTGLAIDAAGNFYPNGTFKINTTAVSGVYVNLAANADNPSSNPSRTIPWDPKTELAQYLTSDDSIDASGEVYVGNILLGSGSPTTCQALVNVYAAGATGGITDVKPLRVLTLSGVRTTNAACYNPKNNPLIGFYPYAVVYGSSVFVADQFNGAVDVFSATKGGTVAPLRRIAGSATGLSVPLTVYVSSYASNTRRAGAP
ncbi:MAG TPA: hypothetical protein VMF61_14915 [Candidatus Acidoferrales bacterium]|nr:hypothetical protein [Candidatus Acidoferrales bacterium]